MHLSNAHILNTKYQISWILSDIQLGMKEPIYVSDAGQTSKQASMHLGMQAGIPKGCCDTGLCILTIGICICIEVYVVF